MMVTPGSRKLQNIDILNIAGLIAVCSILMVALAFKLVSLVWLDPAWTLQEMFRVSVGQMPYRDFTWPYPPLAAVAYGNALRWFGARFSVVQTIVDVLGVMIVALVYTLFRRLLPKSLHLVACLLLICVLATTQTYFSLFSLVSYGTQLHTAAIGLLLFILGMLLYIDRGSMAVLPAALICVGCWIALLSKQEPYVAVASTLVLLALFDLGLKPWSIAAWMRQYALLAAGCLLPVFAVFAWYARQAGWASIQDALTGYGMLAVTCPWWPTGVSVWGMAAALGMGIAVIALLSLLRRERWQQRLGGRRYRLLWAAAMAGAIVYAGYELQVNHDDMYSAAPLLNRIRAVTKTLLSTSSIMRPVLWAAIVWWLVMIATAIRRRGKLTRPELQFLLIITVPIALNIRSLFGSLYSTPYPEIAALCYPFILITAPYLLWRTLQVPENGVSIPALRVVPGKREAAVVSCLILAYCAIRIAGAYPELLSDRPYQTVDTQAGSIKLKHADVNAQIYRYVMENTSPGDTIIELPFGGGMGFATGRETTTYTTLYSMFRPTEGVQRRDLDAIVKRPPSVVIAQNRPHFGTHFGFEVTLACPCPRLVWVPDRLQGDDAVVFPFVTFIEKNYHVDRTIQNWVILRPNQPLSTPAGQKISLVR